MEVSELAVELLKDEDGNKTLDRCAKTLQDLGLDVTMHREVGALVARRGHGGIALSGHVDVVPAGEGWRHPPFGGSVVGDRLYGRGAVDMRGPVACMLHAVGATEEPVQVVLTTDEETTMDGVRSLVEREVLGDASLVVVGEPTGLDVVAASKGVLWVRLNAEGSRGHGSTPRGEGGRGPSAPERLVDALKDVPHHPIRLEHPGLGPATAAVTGLGCEDTPFNVLAGEASARIDCRFPPPGSPRDVEASLRSKLGFPREGLSLEVVKREPAFLGSEEHAGAVVDVLTQAGLSSGVEGVMFASEAGHWQRVASTLVCGPGSIDRAHAPDEFVTVEELEAGARAYEALVRWGGP